MRPNRSFWQQAAGVTETMKNWEYALTGGGIFFILAGISEGSVGAWAIGIGAAMVIAAMADTVRHRNGE